MSALVRNTLYGIAVLIAVSSVFCFSGCATLATPPVRYATTEPSCDDPDYPHLYIVYVLDDIGRTLQWMGNRRIHVTLGAGLEGDGWVVGACMSTPTTRVRVEAEGYASQDVVAPAGVVQIRLKRVVMAN
jgi:hypothetical protein